MIGVKTTLIVLSLILGSFVFSKTLIDHRPAVPPEETHHRYVIDAKEPPAKKACIKPTIYNRTPSGVKALLKDFTADLLDENECPKVGLKSDSLKRVCSPTVTGFEIKRGNSMAEKKYKECLKAAKEKGTKPKDLPGYIPPFANDCECDCSDPASEACWGKASTKIEFNTKAPKPVYFEKDA